MGRKKTILLVEGDESIRRQLHSLLSENFEMLLASDGVEAMACYELDAERIAAVITECYLPRLDGVDLTVWLRQRDPELPVIMTTGSLKGKNFGPLLNFRNFILLWKPFDVAQLVDLITTYTAKEPSPSGTVG